MRIVQGVPPMLKSTLKIACCIAAVGFAGAAVAGDSPIANAPVPSADNTINPPPGGAPGARGPFTITVTLLDGTIQTIFIPGVVGAYLEQYDLDG